MTRRIIAEEPLLFSEQLNDVDANKYISRLNWVIRGRWMEDDEQIAYTQIQLQKAAGWIVGPFDRLSTSDEYPITREAVAKAFFESGAQEVIVSVIPGENPLYVPPAFRLNEVSERALSEAIHAIRLRPYAVAAFNKSPFHAIAAVLNILDFDDYGLCVGPKSFVTSILGDLEAAMGRLPYEMVHDSDPLPTNTGLGSAFARRIISSIQEYNCAEPGYTVLFPG
uniref:Uncharacterized protein n=1 Tax=mine drainage metagenome TaxID=410659 RepID=E6Q309_9ZZZZ